MGTEREREKDREERMTARRKMFYLRYERITVALHSKVASI